MARPRRLKNGKWEITTDGAPHPDGGRRQVRRRYDTSDEARKALAEFELERLQQRAVNASGPALGAVIEGWLEEHGADLSPTTLRRYEGIVNSHILDSAIAGVPIVELTADDFRGWLRHVRAKPGRRDRQLSPRTVRHCYRLASVVLNDAVRRGILDRSPLTGVHVPVVRANPDETRAWTVEEVGTFMKTLDSSSAANATTWQNVWGLLLATGLRRGELVGLRWSDIDFDAQTLTVRRTRLAGLTNPAPPKTKGAARTVPLSSEALGFLRPLRAQQEASRRILGSDWPDTGFVVVLPDGGIPHPDSVTKRFREDCDRSGVPYISVHGLRHTFATLALAAGVPAHIVSRALGHHSVAFTLATYSHVLPGAHQEAMDAAGRHIFQTDGKPGEKTEL